jgi:hypothetical protein
MRILQQILAGGLCILTLALCLIMGAADLTMLGLY